MTKGDSVFAAYVLNGEVIIEEATVAAVGDRLVRIDSGGRGFHWKRIFRLGEPGYSESRLAALESLLADTETDVLRARGWLARAESTRDLVQATLAGETVR